MSVCLDQIHVARREGGGPGEQLEEVECRPFSGEQRGGRAPKGEQQLIRRDPVSVRHLGMELDPFVHLSADFDHPGQAADHAGIPGDHTGRGEGGGIDQRSGDVAAAHVLGEGQADVVRDGGAERALVHAGRQVSHSV